ncbi:MAG TPA: PKD domain-containing protein [Blastocatellia bacterium]
MITSIIYKRPSILVGAMLIVGLLMPIPGGRAQEPDESVPSLSGHLKIQNVLERVQNGSQKADVPGQFRALTQLADPIGFHMGPFPDPSSCTELGLPEDPEPNDDFATAVSLRVPAGPQGCIDSATDLDFYVFSIPDGASLTISATSASRELFQLDLFDRRHQLVASSPGLLDFRSAASGDYFLRVSFGSASCYGLAISVETPPVPPPSIDLEPNDDFTTAVPAPTLPAGVGCIDPATDLDFYAFAVPERARLQILGIPADSVQVFDMALFNASQQLVASSHVVQIDRGSIATFIDVPTAPAGQYFVRVSSASTGCYGLGVHIIELPPPPPPIDLFEPNDDFATAVPAPTLSAGVGVGCIDPATDLDFYAFAVPERAQLQISAIPADSVQVFDIALFDASQQLVASSQVVQIDGGSIATFIDVPTAPPGQYFVRVSSASTGCYRLGVHIIEPTPGGNHPPPAADAGWDQRVNEGSAVALHGLGSFYDGRALTYQWVQTAGPMVMLSGSMTAQPAFTAPAVGRVGATLTFVLTVSDGIRSAVDSIDVVVEDVNHQPRADAGADQTRDEGSLVRLDGSASTDPDGDALTYAWIQTRGPGVTLSDAHDATPTFTAPPVGPGGATLAFQLVVSDGAASSRPDEVIVTVQHVNHPPRCDLARASQAVLWPPNHKLIPVSITGVTDPDNDQVTINVTAVTQDEPVNGLGDGDTSPDAVLQGGNALLRAERTGTGNGRIYAIHFMAGDSLGGTCTGTLTVGVPHDATTGSSILDDGQVYDSAQSAGALLSTPVGCLPKPPMAASRRCFRLPVLNGTKEINLRVDALRQALRGPQSKDVEKTARAVEERVMQSNRALVGDELLCPSRPPSRVFENDLYKHPDAQQFAIVFQVAHVTDEGNPAALQQAKVTKEETRWRT